MVSSQNSCPLEPQHMTLLGNGVLNVVKIRMVMSLYGIWGGSSAGKESTCNAGNPDLIPESRRSPGEGIGYPLQYSWASLVAQTVMQCRRPEFYPCVGKIPLEEGMATHSSILIWRIPMDRGAWQATVHGVAKSWTQLSDL